MKRTVPIILTFLVLMTVATFTGCQSVKDMSIGGAQLTEEEARMNDMLCFQGGSYFFDYGADDQVKRMEFAVYELVDGTWKSAGGDCSAELSAPAGRIALNFQYIPNGVNIAVQNDGRNSAFTTNTTDTPGDFSSMGAGATSLTDERKIVYEKDIPLVIQVLTTADESAAFPMEFFDSPEDYEIQEGDRIYAVAVRFSKKPLE